MAQTQTQTSNTLSVVLGTNQIVERCFSKMANDVTLQVRDKLIDIILAVLARECEDFDVEMVRRLILAEIPEPSITIEKRAKTQDATTKTTKTKTIELDAEGNPIKAARKEKAPKAPKEPKAPKAAAMTEEEKAAKKAEKEAAKEAAKAAKQAEKEAAKAAKQAEKEAAKAAEKEAEKESKVKAPKETRIPIPWCGVSIADRCQALRSYHGLFAQCTADSTEICEMCPACEKAGAPFGTVAMRKACGLFDYTDPKGNKCVRLANVVDKFKVEGGIDAFIAEAAKHGIEIPAEHLNKELKARGRPKSVSPRASKGKVSTADTTPASSRNVSDADNSDTETEDEHTVTVSAKPAKQARKKVVKTTDAAANAEAPKKRGRPAKAKEPAVEVNESLIHDLVASAAGKATESADELVEETIVPIATTPAKKAPGAPKKVAAPKKKARATEVVNGMTMWVETYEGSKVWVNPEDMGAYDASNGEGVGTWDDVKKTIVFDEEEIEQFSDEE